MVPKILSSKLFLSQWTGGCQRGPGGSERGKGVKYKLVVQNTPGIYSAAQVTGDSRGKL